MESKCVFFKGVFTKAEMSKLAKLLKASQLFEYKIDKTCGNKEFFTNGKWTEQAHARPGIDTPHPAGLAGKSGSDENEHIADFLKILAVKVSNLLWKYRDDVQKLVSDLDNDYNSFHLFMCPRGISKMHKDQNDLLSFMFKIQKVKSGGGGQLELGGTNLAIDWNVGDAIMIDSSQISHGSRLLNLENLEKGAENERMVGLFLVQKPYLRVNGKNI